MTDIKILTILEMRSLFGMNKFLHTKNPKEKNRARLLFVVFMLLIILAISYIGGLVYGLSTLGLASMVPTYLIVICSFIIFLFSIFKAGNTIFGIRGYDLLSSMPVTASGIVMGRFLAMYIENLIVTFIVMLPGITVFGIYQRPGIAFYLIGFLGTLLIPALPLVCSTLFGTIIMAISSRMKHKSLIQTILMLALVSGIFLGSYKTENLTSQFTPEDFSKLAIKIESVLESIYPPAAWLGTAMLRLNIQKLLLFFFLSLGCLILTIYFVSRNFHSIMHRLQTLCASHDYEIRTLEPNSMQKALYTKERKRYFSSSIYVTNTIIGPIMGCGMSIALYIAGLDTLQSTIPPEIPITKLIPFLVGAIFCTMPTTSTSISMEGKQIELIQSLPITTKTWLDSKIRLNLILILPFYLLAELFLVLAVKPDFVNLIFLILIPALLILFAVVCGITVNLKFHSFDWDKEEYVVKQSVSSMLGGFVGMFLSVALGGGIFLLPTEYEMIAKCGIGLLLLLITAILYRKNNQVQLKEL